MSWVILGDHVTTDSGTGIVHTASGFGETTTMLVLLMILKSQSPLTNGNTAMLLQPRL